LGGLTVSLGGFEDLAGFGVGECGCDGKLHEG
jgi:hypothetical protein